MADTKQVDPSEEFSFPHLVKWAEMVTRAYTEQALRDLPVSGSQLFVLVLLEDRGEATSAELARMMRITPQALTTVLRPLREDGYVERRTDQAHNRRLLLRLAQKGCDLLHEARLLSPAIESDLLSDFTLEERVTLKRLLARVAGRFE